MKLLLVAILVFAISCNNKKQDNPETVTGKDTTAVLGPVNEEPMPVAKETAVTDTLLTIPFIIKSNNYIDSFSNHRHGIAFITDTTDRTYLVKAGYNGDDRFETYYDFEIDKNSGEIKVMDPVEGDYIPLKVYLKNNQ
ncbi:MAG: hypothetical protein IPG86_05925 [Chitinophagaceae bacterium]|nr:hypothetical protein [Chitinophagaceae bacterium]